MEFDVFYCFYFGLCLVVPLLMKPVIELLILILTFFANETTVVQTLLAFFTICLLIALFCFESTIIILFLNSVTTSLSYIGNDIASKKRNRFVSPNKNRL